MEKAISIGIYSEPDGIAITPNGTTAYVAEYGQDSVVPINLATNTAGKPISVGHLPRGVAVTPNGAMVYVTNIGATTVTPITTATNKAGKPIQVGNGPIAIVINHG